MIYMCQIYEFPKPIVLPTELEVRLGESAKDYVKILTDILQYFEHENFDEEELLKVMEVILVTYLQNIDEAIDELGF